MDGLGHSLLAHAGFAEDHHGQTARRDFGQVAKRDRHAISHQIAASRLAVRSRVGKLVGLESFAGELIRARDEREDAQRVAEANHVSGSERGVGDSAAIDEDSVLAAGVGEGANGTFVKKLGMAP